MSSPTGTHYINLTTSCLPCMSDIIAHTDISTRTSQSNVKANKLDVNDTQYDGTCKGSSSEDLQKDDESSSPHKVLALSQCHLLNLDIMLLNILCIVIHQYVLHLSTIPCFFTLKCCSSALLQCHLIFPIIHVYVALVISIRIPLAYSFTFN